jgi:hypothetical protein
MRSGIHRVAVMLAILTLGVANLGCAAFEASSLSTMHAATLDEARTVRLAEYVQHSAVLRGPEHNFTELWLVTSDDTKKSERPVCKRGVCLPGGTTMHVIARRGGQDGKSAERFKFGQLEAYGNTTGDQVWIVDRENARVVATLDLKTSAATGPDDEPPPWATLTWGVRLNPVDLD